MKNLNWFQARDLAVQERRAIRRALWTHWIYYRSALWFHSETFSSTLEPAVDKVEIRRVVRSTDFTSNEFLAKELPAGKEVSVRYKPGNHGRSVLADCPELEPDPVVMKTNFNV